MAELRLQKHDRKVAGDGKGGLEDTLTLGPEDSPKF